MNKPSLTVHINTAAKRKRHEAADHLAKAAKRMADDKSMVGYALVTWSERGEGARTSFDDGGAMPDFVVPEYVKQVLAHRISGDYRD